MNRTFRNTSVVLFVFLISVIFILLEKQNITDWYKLYNYKAPSAIASLSSQDTFTPYATKLYYINHPVLISGNQFRTQCPNSDASSSSILGCYHPTMNGIYLYIVSDPTLNGVEQVTAAHEMLHAAWSRLDSNKKTILTKELNDFYTNDLQDSKIKNEIAIYQKTEPFAVADEMHSTFGTECPNLPTDLENYYKALFINRETVVGFSIGYKQIFTNYQNQIKEDNLQLQSIKSNINNDLNSISSKFTDINNLKSRMDVLLRERNFSQYNQDVSIYNQQIDEYNNLIQTTKDLIAQYNDLVSQVNSTSTVFNNLSSELNSNLSTLPTK
jgi:hypothetical protein